MKCWMSLVWTMTLVLCVFGCSKDPVHQVDQTPDPPPVITPPPPPVDANQVPEILAPILTAVHDSINTSIRGFYRALPARYDSTTKNYPLLLTLHGVDDMGDGMEELSKVLNRAIPKLLSEKSFPPSFTSGGNDYSFIVISPQFWIKPSAKQINDMVSHAVKEYRVDTARIYVTGHSMGGGLAWDYAVDYGSRIAALVPVCGSNSFVNEFRSAKIAKSNLPVWAFHNEDDATVPVSTTREFIELINNHHPDPLSRKTIWPSGGHDAWTKATNSDYKEDGLNIYEWMLAYER